jgi:hypothetical protein
MLRHSTRLKNLRISGMLVPSGQVLLAQIVKRPPSTIWVPGDKGRSIEHNQMTASSSSGVLVGAWV